MTERAPLTTGQIAKHCGVNFRTVIRWIERGHIKAYKLPGRGDNRVQVEDFVAFLEGNNMPVPEEFVDNKKLLVVDDDVSMAKAMARALKRGRYHVEIAHNGFEAGAKLVASKPALITLDLNMPGVSGIDVLKEVRERFGSTVKVLVVSGASPAELEHARLAGCDDVLEKPFENSELLARISALVGS